MDIVYIEACRFIVYSHSVCIEVSVCI